MAARIARAIVALAFAAAPAAAAAPSTHLLVIVGLGGDPEHAALFQKWGKTLADAAVDTLGVPKDNVILLPDERTTRNDVVKAFGTLASRVGEDDTVVVVLFGFGTYAGKVAKFNLLGPDMTPQDFAPLLAKLRSRRVVFVDTTTASGPFVEALSAPGRVIVAATRTGAEVYATLFGGPFVDAFSNPAADADHDGKVSILEAFQYARAQVAATYQREGLMQTEHPILDDNGDKEGSLDPGPQGKDGQAAAVLGLGSLNQQALPADEKLRALYVERQELERRIDALKLLKSSMDQEKYGTELEKLATELALKTRQIRAAEGKR